MHLHTTLIYAGLAGLLLVVLSFNVMQNWVRATGEGRSADRALRRAERLLSSFVEYVPLGLFLLMLIEIKNTPPMILHGLGGALITGRVLHAIGSNDMPAAGLARFIGSQLTFLMIAIASMACLYYYALERL